MKIFVHTVLANLTALAVAALILCGSCLLVLMFLAGSVFSGKDRPSVPQGAALVINLAMNIPDAPSTPGIEAVVQEAMQGGVSRSHYLLEVVEAIDRAAEDPRISVLLLHGSLISENYGSGLAALREVRQAVTAFRESGKAVIAYAVEPTQRDYYLMSAASELILNPYGVVPLNGLAVNAVYFGNAFNKYGIGVQATRAGKYKSATEMFTGEAMSAPDREQFEALLEGLWDGMLRDIARSRALDAGDLRRISRQSGLFQAGQATAAGLVDSTAYFDQVVERLRQSTGAAEQGDGFRQISLRRYLRASGVTEDLTDPGWGPAIAVVYAEGDILPGSGFSHYIGADWLARELRELRQDERVRAVVLRVNSPGGSAVASEIIQREMRATAAVKPVVVSLGSYAASGGYWIAAYGDFIFADPATITGSIGVWGVLFNVRDLANRHGITFDSVKTGAFADMHTLTRPKTQEEMTLIQGFVDQLYDDFVAKVAEGRDLDIAVVERLAQGRLWTGRDAVSLGLVDQVGGLRDAINEAAHMSGIDTYNLIQVPRPRDWSEALMEMFTFDEDAPPLAASPDPLASMLRQIREDYGFLSVFSDPRGIYARLPYRIVWE